MNARDPQPSLATAFEHINQLCDRFTREWRARKAPSIEAYLEEAGPSLRGMLLRNLLTTEYGLREKAGERPTSEEYLRRFPDDEELVRRALLVSVSLAQSTSISYEHARDTSEVVPATELFVPPPARSVGPYILGRKLGQGGFGAVYEAVHEQGGSPVALKLLPSNDAANTNAAEEANRLHRFRNEFRAVAEINHPNLIGLHELEADGGQWFFTMDLIEGMDFLSYVRPNGELDEQRLRSAIAQLARGVSKLHAHSIVHRDLKPSNVLVDAHGRVIILDFGLVSELQRDRSMASTKHFAGTPAYAAPEQFDGQVSAASDWYAVGMMLYEAIAGECPYLGSLIRIVEAKRTMAPPPIESPPEVVAGLAEFCLRLLESNPRSRPRQEEISEVVGVNWDQHAPELIEHPLVARERQLAQLDDALQAFRYKDQPVTVFVSGKSGEGKSALIDKFLSPLREDRRLTILSGRCYDRESVPFKALDSLIDALCDYLQSLSGKDAAVLLPDDVAMLAQVFPVMRRIEVIEEKSSGVNVSGLDDQQVRLRAFSALRLLIQRMGRRAPIIMFIDDLQWGDADSAEVMFQVLRPPDAPAVMFLGSFRRDEQEGSAFLQEWETLQEFNGVKIAGETVAVGPLNIEECAELLVSETGRDTEVIRRRAEEFHAKTGGNAYLMLELIGCFDPDTDSFEDLPVHAVIDRKLSNLPNDARALLDVIAVSGQALPVNESILAADEASAARSTIVHMRNERLLRLVGSGDDAKVDTYHDRIRETTLENLAPETRGTLHLRLAEAIEQTSGAVSEETIAALDAGEEVDDPSLTRVYDQAYHFDAAGEKRRARSYALVSAERARRQHALEVALEQYATAERNFEAAENQLRYRTALGRSDTLIRLGRYDEAIRCLDGVDQFATNETQKARIDVLVGESFFKQGSISQSIAHYERGLQRLGHRVPRSTLKLGWSIVREVLIQSGHTCFPRRLHKQPNDERFELAIWIRQAGTYPYWFTSMPKVVWGVFTGMNLSERIPASRALVTSYSHHGVVMSLIGWRSRAHRYAGRALELAKELNDEWARAYATCYQGFIGMGEGRYALGIDKFTEAAQSFLEVGDSWMHGMSRFHLGYCLERQGRLLEAIDEARTTFAATTRQREDTLAHNSIYLWSRAAGGGLPFDELRERYRPIPDNIVATCHGLMAEGHWHRFHGRVEEALKAFDRAWAISYNSFDINLHTTASLPALITALREGAEAISNRNGSKADSLRKRAFRLARWSVRLTRFFPPDHPHSLRELALAYQAKGRLRRALRLAVMSCSFAETQESPHELAQSKLVAARLEHKIGIPEATARIEQAEAELSNLKEMIRQAESHAGLP